MSFKIGDRIAVYISGGRFTGQIREITLLGSLFVVEDRFLNCHKESPFHPKQCRRLKPKVNATIRITSNGYKFQDMENGAWKDLATGITWHDVEPEKYTHYQAVEKFGDRLPTIEEFETAEKHEFREILPNIKNRWFWSSSLDSSNPEYARIFSGDYGCSDYGVRDCSYYSVRLVSRE